MEGIREAGGSAACAGTGCMVRISIPSRQSPDICAVFMAVSVPVTRSPLTPSKRQSGSEHFTHPYSLIRYSGELTGHYSFKWGAIHMRSSNVGNIAATIGLLLASLAAG